MRRLPPLCHFIISAFKGLILEDNPRAGNFRILPGKGKNIRKTFQEVFHGITAALRQSGDDVQTVQFFDALAEGRGYRKKIALLEEMADTIRLASLCALGKTASNPVLSMLLYFLLHR
jgi:hypothetical protein